MIFLMKSTWYAKHLEHTKNGIKTLIWKVYILLFNINTINKYSILWVRNSTGLSTIIEKYLVTVHDI